MSIALPLMMGLALEQLIGMTDVLFLGRYGEAELAAAGVAGIYVMLVMMLGLGYTVGSQSLMSRANGAGRAEEVGAIFRQSAIFMTACGFVIMLASWFLIGPMFERFIAADAVRKAADDYVFWRLAGGDSGLASGSSSGLSQRSGRWVLMRLRRSVGCAQRPSTGIVNLQTMNFYILSSNCFHRRRSCFSSVTAADAKFE